MIQVKIDGIGDACVQMEQQYSEYCQLNGEIEKAIQILNTMSSKDLDDLVKQLKKQKEDMEHNQAQLGRMAQGLDKIAISYIQCENEVCDFGEQLIYRFPREEVGYTDLSDVTGMLSKIVFA